MSLLAEYYNSIAAENAAKRYETMAQADLINAQSQQVAPNAQSQRDEAASRVRSNDAGANRINKESGQVDANAASARQLQASQSTGLDTTSRLAGPLAGSEIGLRSAQSSLYGAEAKAQASHVDPTLLGTGGISPIQRVGGIITGIGSTPTDSTTNDDDVQKFAKGGKVATKAQLVHGKSSKPGPTDTVPTMLTPGEGVLNKGAMEHYGTDVLDHMNKMGLMRMGAQSEAAAHLGLPDPHAKAKGKDEKGNKKMGKDGKPAVKTDIPGFAKGGVVPKAPVSQGPPQQPWLLPPAPPSGMPLLHTGLYGK